MNRRAGTPILAVAVPARDEAMHIGGCLKALDGQIGACLDHIVLLLNNCTDGTAEIARSIAMRPGTKLHIVERALPPALANAGHARRLSMDIAAGLAGPEGVLMTTDADGRVDPDWAARTLAALANGADAVAGWAELDPLDWGRIPLRLHEDDARECAYDVLCDEIHARLDPDLSDPLPRHTQNSGASLAMTTAAFRLCGGVPDVASGEDRALVEALRSIDARVRHDPSVHVVVSGRTEGRAAGGMADTIRRRLSHPDEFIDLRLEPARDCAQRASAKATARRLFSGAAADVGALSCMLHMPAAAVLAALDKCHFGVGWAVLEATSPVLARRAVPLASLAVETANAQAIVAALRWRVPPLRTATSQAAG